MNKKDFTVYIEKQLEGMSLDKQIKVLQKIQNEYLVSIINKKKKRAGTFVEPEERDKYTFCDKCKKYYLTPKGKIDLKTEIRTETTYTDAGYGDDDRVGEVEYMVRYITCPLCSHKQEESKLYLRLIRDWNRREGRRD